MYYKIDSRQSILRIDDTYAHLKQMYDDGSLMFEFRYSINQSDAIRNSATKVDVTVFNRTINKKPLLGVSGVGKINAKELINNILTDTTSAKTTLKNQDNYTLNKKFSDVSAFISNEAVGEIKSGKAIKDIQSLRRSKLKTVAAGELKESNDIKPVLHNLNLNTKNLHLKVSSSIEENSRRLNHDLILRRGIDPSEVATLTSNVIHSRESLQGTSRQIKRKEDEVGTLNRLHDHLSLNANLIVKSEKSIFNIDDSRMVDVIVSESVDSLEIPVCIRFKPTQKKMSSKESTDVFVKFELIDPHTGVSIDTITKSLDIAKHIRIYQTPIDPPIVKQVKSEVSSRVNLEIRQVDKSADSVFLYKKNLYTSSVDIDDYSLVGTYNVQGNQTALVQAQMPQYGSSIYRCVPSRHGVQGFSYTNTIVKSRKYRSIKSLSLTSHIENNGIVVEARKLPVDVVSIQFMQRNLSLHKSTYSNIEQPKLIDDVTRSSDYVSVVSRDVLDNNIYEYAVRAYFHDGTSEIIESEIIEYVLPTPGKVDITINNVLVNYDNDIDVSFDIQLNVNDTSLEEIKSILDKQGNKSYFEEDIAKQRQQLKDILAYSIHRIDVSTGEREDMGVITNVHFSDKATGAKRSVKQLKLGHTYRYVISAVTRAAETAFESFQKTVIDETTKKKYTFSPSKFLHPIALKRGMLVTPAGLKTRYTKSILEHGVLGSNTIIDVSINEKMTNVIEANVSTFDREHNIITWRISGEISSIDHFVIMKEVHGIRTILGCAHTHFSHGNCQWIHKLTNNDRGQLRYVIVPINGDYRRGQEVMTNMLLVEDRK